MDDRPERLGRRELLPFLGLLMLGFLTVALPPEPDWSLYAGGAGLAIGLGVALVTVPRLREPGWGVVVAPLWFLLVVAVLREAQGGAASGYAPLTMAPVVWVALFAGRRQLHAVVAGVAAVFVIPLVGLSGSDYPSSEWRRAVLWVVVSLVVGHIVQRLVEGSRVRTRQVRAERDRFESVLRAATEYSIIGTDLEGTITVFNDGAERMLGYRPEHMVGRETPEIIHLPGEVAERAADLGIDPGFEVFVHRARTGTPERRDWTYVRADGSHLPVSLTVSAIAGDDGRPRGFIGIAQDISAQQQAETALRRSERRHRTLVANLPDAAIMVVDRGLVVQAVEGRMLDREGFDRTAFEGQPLASALPAENFAALEPALRAAIGGASTSLEYGSHLDATKYSAEVAPYEQDGIVEGAILVARDITARKAAEAEVRAAERQFVESFEHAPIGMEMIDLEGRFTRVNPALAEIVGYQRGSLIGLSTEAVTDPEDIERDRELRRSLLAGEADRYDVEKRFIHHGGHAVDVAVHLSLVRDHEGTPRYFVGQVLDITERKRFEARLQHMADHDPLTGLLNRRRFEAELERHVGEMRRYGRQGAVIVLDIDGFKQVNDSLGHDAGDELIVTVAGLLRTQLRESDQLGRLGGDEFAILLPRADREQAAVVAAKLNAAVREGAGTATRPGPRAITISVGVAMLGEGESVTCSQAIVDADLAMYAAKEAGRDRHAFSDAHHRAQPGIHARTR